MKLGLEGEASRAPKPRPTHKTFKTHSHPLAHRDHDSEAMMYCIQVGCNWRVLSATRKLTKLLRHGQNIERPIGNTTQHDAQHNAQGDATTLSRTCSLGLEVVVVHTSKIFFNFLSLLGGFVEQMKGPTILACTETNLNQQLMQNASV